MDTAGFEDEREPWAKEYRQRLEAGKEKEQILLESHQKGHGPANMLILALWVCTSDL